MVAGDLTLSVKVFSDLPLSKNFVSVLSRGVNGRFEGAREGDELKCSDHRVLSKGVPSASFASRVYVTYDKETTASTSSLE